MSLICRHRYTVPLVEIRRIETAPGDVLIAWDRCLDCDRLFPVMSVEEMKRMVEDTMPRREATP